MKRSIIVFLVLAILVGIRSSVKERLMKTGNAYFLLQRFITP